MTNNGLSGVVDYIKKFFQKQPELAIAGILLVIVLIVLLMPTIGAVRTIDVKPEEYAGISLTLNTPLANDIFVPASELTYFIAWAQEGSGASNLNTSDYETVVLEIKNSEGQIIRTATRPTAIKRADVSALLFKFSPLKVNKDERLFFTLQQTGRGAVLLHNPLRDAIRTGETATMAFQLGARKNWLTLLIDNVYAENLEKQDISSYFHRGQQIVQGENPYACVLQEKLCVGYPAHLPAMYLVAAGLVKLGVNDITTWSAVIRPMVFAAWLGVGAILFIYILRRKQPALAVAAFGFWLFNRWSIDVLRIAHTDFFGVFFLLLAVVLVWRRPRLAAILFGVSIAIKQLAILAIPIFVLAVWRQKNISLAKLAVFVGLITLVPVVTLLPFLINNPQATVQGLLFVTERSAQTVHGFAPSLDAWLDITGPGKSMIMLLFITGVYVAVWRKSVNLISGMLMLMAILMGFTSVLYNQYFVWLIPFIPLAIADMRRLRKTEDTKIG